MFLPRRASTEPYDDVTDEHCGINIYILADEYFTELSVHTIGPLELTRGFSTFRPIPTRPDHLLALKTEEVRGVINTFLVVYRLSDGRPLLDPPLHLGNVKYEGLEFLP